MRSTTTKTGDYQSDRGGKAVFAAKESPMGDHSAQQASNGPGHNFARLNVLGHRPAPTMLIQPKLTVNQPGDRYEREADAVADRVMRMAEPTTTGTNAGIRSTISTIQRKCAACEKEEKVQRKEAGLLAKPFVSSAVEQTLQSVGQPLDNPTRSFMESRFGYDFGNVRVHNDSVANQSSTEINALAYTNRNNIVFGAGQYQPESERGQRLLAHELTHVVQQERGVPHKSGSMGVVQRYVIAATPSPGSESFRVSDDLSVAVKEDNTKHDLFAIAGKAAAANAELAKVSSGIELIEKGTGMNVSKGSVTKSLVKVIPKNTINNTQGSGMKISDDCGKSCAVVVGGTRRTALHRDAQTGRGSNTSATTPALMKAEIMKKLLDKWIVMPSISAALVIEISNTLTRAEEYKRLEMEPAEKDIPLAGTEAEKDVKRNIYWQKVTMYSEIMMSFYNKQPETNREKIDEYLEINQFASPKVGQGYTMSTGGANYPGENTWNFHWGGVVMKSNNNMDTITLENYAVAGDVENTDWEFGMYGPATKGKQTFHEQHEATKQHGDRPTTMTIEKK